MYGEKLLQLKSYLSLKYDIAVKDITPVKNVVRITTDQGDKCLKRVRYGKSHFLFILSAMKHLYDNGFKSTLPFIPTIDGELYIELEDGFGFLTDWVKSRECNYSNPVELKMAAVTLARLHKNSEGYIPAEGVEPRIGWGKWISIFSRRIEEMLAFKDVINGNGILTHFDRIYIENFDYYLGQAIAAIENLKNTKYLELTEQERKKNSFCHHDYAHHNVLISDDFKVYIIDFDYCICDTRIHDVSSLIIRNMRHGNWNMEKAQFIVDCYRGEGYILKDEIPVISAFMEFPQDFWQVGLQYYIEKQKWEEDNFNKRLNNVIKDRIDRQKFLDKFKVTIEL